MGNVMDYKTAFKELYQPPKKPGFIQVPSILFIAIDGQGAPESDAYQQAIKIFYSLAFTIKMSPKSGSAPDGYFEYKVPPLEGFWEADPENMADDRNSWKWTSVIRQPEFVTPLVFDWAREKAQKKNPDLPYERARLWQYEEGACVQCMHVGPYSEEPRTMQAIREYIDENHYKLDLSDQRRHHEIYLGDPRKATPNNLKTVLRQPVVKV